MTAGVEIDTRELIAAVHRLAGALDAGGKSGAQTEAERTAAAIARNVPRRTGRLAATVATVAERDGYAVTYGGGLPYAGYIENRTGAVADATADADRSFVAAMVTLAETEARKL